MLITKGLIKKITLDSHLYSIIKEGTLGQGLLAEAQGESQEQGQEQGQDKKPQAMQERQQRDD